MLKWRKGVTGAKWTDHQRNSWKERVQRFFKSYNDENDGEKRKRLKYNVVTIPRQATLCWLRDTSNAMKGAMLCRR